MPRQIPPISRAGHTADPSQEQPFGLLQDAAEVPAQAGELAIQRQTPGQSSPLLSADTPTDALATPRDVLVALNYGLELVRCGAMLVAFEGKPHLANRAAMAILEKKDGISLARTGLIADRASDTRLLQQLLQEAISSPERGEPQGSPISLPRRSARTSLIVRVVPGPGLDCWPAVEHRTALMTMYDEDKGLQIDESLLCRLYGLTRGEAALAAILIQGKSIEEAATELFISPHTARTHLKRIFMKTDTHRQTELVVRIFSAVL
jgi:DNA-binding CsgD family transcriptional regulator